MKLEDAEEVVIFFMDKYNLRTQGWTYNFSNAFKWLGRCSYRSKQLKFSRYWTALHGRDVFTDTVLHEIAHALMPGHDHDERWRAVAQAIGGTGEVSHSFVLRPADHPWQGVCYYGHRTWHIRKPRNIERSMCGPCLDTRSQYVPWTWTHRGKPYPTEWSTYIENKTYKELQEIFS